jgi:hypothetical protein
MRVVLYEWCCSGGLWGPDALDVVGGEGVFEGSAGLVAEGRAMVMALLKDGIRSPDLQLELLLDAHLPAVGVDLPVGVKVTRVARGNDGGALVRAAAAADWTVIVAPETGGALAARVASARSAGARVAAPAAAFIDVAGNKQATALTLAGAGVPVPAGRILLSGEPLPEEFIRPAVVKALSSCGGDGVMLLPRGADLPPAPVPRRIEAAVAGTPVGVSCLCGPAGVFPLPPVRHHFSAGPTPRFLGGDIGLRPHLARRASSLAGRAVRGIADATQPPCGWVGIDMILGEREDGADDRVLEVNPRLTTSFVGLAKLGATSLLEAMLSVAGGDPCRWPALSGGDGMFSVAGEGPDACLVAHDEGSPGR